jgi:hypothetical protein
LQDRVLGNNADLSTITSGSVDYEEPNIDEAGAEGGLYRRIWNISDDDPEPNNKAITVIVTWNQDKQKVSISSVKRL